MHILVMGDGESDETVQAFEFAVSTVLFEHEPEVNLIIRQYLGL